jgi:signal transduction histidine kinase
VSPTDPRIRRGCVETLYRQAPNSFAAAAVVTIYMVITAWPYTPRGTILAWLAVQLVTQVLRGALIVGHRRAGDGRRFERWNAAYAAYLALAGLVWGSCAFLFIHPGAPISVALTLCGLYGISSGSIPGNAYNPPGVTLFVGGIFSAVLVRMLALGDLAHVTLGIASFGFAIILILFTRVQHRTIVENFRIRFENEALLEQLQVEKANADDARERAEQANLAKSQFLAAASHDLRQPLYALSLFSSTLQTLQLDEQAQAVVAKIHGNIAALESLFNALLDISRLEAGVVRPQAEPVSVRALFERLEHYFEREPHDRVMLKLLPVDRYVHADSALLERMLSNLLSNALRYTPEGRVLLGCRRAGSDALRFEIWDTGIGIAPADQARIFEDFVQVGNPERDRRKGLGLGLAIARRTAELLDTRIAVRSWPGQGSVFSLTLKLAEAPLPAAAAAPSAQLDLVAGLRVLVIDDEPSIREGLAELLGAWGSQVDAVADEAAALASIAGGRRYDILLADYRLRDRRTGLDAIRGVQDAQRPPPACCLVTGEIDAQLLANVRERGIPLLHKPVHPAKLRAVLNYLAVERPAIRVSAPA